MSGDDWQTPDWLLDCVRTIAPIKLDPCTVRDNPTGAEFIRTKECDPDGLDTEWHTFRGLVYVNPPYGRGQMARWADKILLEAERGCMIVALTRGDTSTAWAHSMLRHAEAVCFPKRIKFRGATGSPNFSNLIFGFNFEWSTFSRAFNRVGPVWFA